MFPSAINALIHTIFIGTETPPYDREVIESPFECKSVFCKFWDSKNQIYIWFGAIIYSPQNGQDEDVYRLVLFKSIFLQT